MFSVEHNQKSKLGLLLPISRCAVILVVTYHVINQRVSFGGFTSQEVLTNANWSFHVVLIAVLSAIYFFNSLADLVIDHRAKDREENGTRIQQLLKRNLEIQVVLIFLLFAVSPESAGVFTVLLLSRLRYFFSLKTSLYVFASTIAVFVSSIAFYYGNTLGVLGVVIVTIMAAGFYLFTLIHSHNAVTEKELRHEALRLNKELCETRELLAQSTRQRERLRISRNIHDLLGHQLTGLILNLEAACHLTDGKAHTKVEKSLGLAKSLLGDLRDAVTEIRESAFLDFSQAVQAIIANISELDVVLFVEEGLVIGNAETVETLIRVLQESITNVIRHTDATTCHIRLCREKGQVILQVSDNGSHCNEILPGNGLKGMQERIRGLSGKLSWRNDGAGFVLEATLPLKVI